jgi:hypothetical protein
MTNKRTFEYEIFYTYKIYELDKQPKLIRESIECFDTKSQAECAAIGHITLLEKGQDNDKQV